MGGTFDPIHHGHLVAASEVQALFGLDVVVFERALAAGEHVLLEGAQDFAALEGQRVVDFTFAGVRWRILLIVNQIIQADFSANLLVAHTCLP